MMPLMLTQGSDVLDLKSKTKKFNIFFPSLAGGGRGPYGLGFIIKQDAGYQPELGLFVFQP